MGPVNAMSPPVTTRLVFNTTWPDHEETPMLVSEEPANAPAAVAPWAKSNSSPMSTFLRVKLPFRIAVLPAVSPRPCLCLTSRTPSRMEMLELKLLLA